MRFAIFLIAAAACAQQFVWDGDVHGIVAIRIRGNKAVVESRDASPVANVKFRFESRLPETRQQVRLTVREARGSIRLSAQPSLENDYSVTVSIEDRQDGPGHYSFALDWDAPALPGHRRDVLKWSGTVDGQAVVECRERKCVSEAQRGGPVTGEKTAFTRPVPPIARQVSLDSTTGTADFRILEHPSADNQYTVRVQVRALTPAAPCSFTVSWERPAASLLR